MKKLTQRRTTISKLLVIVLACSMFFITACANLPSGDVQLSASEEAKLTALLGDLNEDASEQVRKDVGALLHKAEDLLQEREAKEDYEKTDKEYELWERITALLDEETISQFGEDNYEEEDVDITTDYGMDTMMNLKKSLSKEDWKKLNKLRNEYFTAIENEDDDYDYDVDIDAQIKDIVGKYKELDADSIDLNLLDDKIQKNYLQILNILKLVVMANWVHMLM